MYKSPFEYLISALATKECVICSSESEMLCKGCQQSYITEIESRCYKCNKLTQQHTLCTSCSAGSALRRVWWLGLYEEHLQRLIYGMKYGRRRQYASEFGNMLSEALPFLNASTLVIGVPTATKRVRRRGYDQALLIAQSFAAARSLQYARPFRRKGQSDQIGKRRQERQQQVESSLYISDAKNLRGATILLVDDVLTTGATLETAAKLLRRRGAKHVEAAIIARHLLK